MAPSGAVLMRHINYVLKPVTVDNAKAKDKRYDLTDGGGLVLEVMPSGSNTWRFKYHLNGKREKVTNIAMGTEIDKINEFEDIDCRHPEGRQGLEMAGLLE